MKNRDSLDPKEVLSKRGYEDHRARLYLLGEVLCHIRNNADDFALGCRTGELMDCLENAEELHNRLTNGPFITRKELDK
jgi:hypothetical protein